MAKINEKITTQVWQETHEEIQEFAHVVIKTVTRSVIEQSLIPRDIYRMQQLSKNIKDEAGQR